MSPANVTGACAMSMVMKEIRVDIVFLIHKTNCTKLMCVCRPTR